MAKNQTSIIKIYTQLYLYYISTLIFMYYSKIIMKNVTVAFIKFQHFCFKDMTNKAKTPRIYNMKRGRKNEKSNMLDIRHFFFLFIFFLFSIGLSYLSTGEQEEETNKREKETEFHVYPSIFLPFQLSILSPSCNIKVWEYVTYIHVYIFFSFLFSL